MIARLRGTLLEKHPTRLVVEVGGIALDVLVPIPVGQAAGAIGSPLVLLTVLVVREDALTLYGFSAPEQRSLFLKLIGVSGIGPKIALGVLSGPSVPELVAAIREQNLALLTRLPGIGKKTAERMSVELRDALAEFERAARPGEEGSGRADAVAALVSLGYTRAAAQAAVDETARESGSEAVELLVRRALARLSAPKR